MDEPMNILFYLVPAVLFLFLTLLFAAGTYRKHCAAVANGQLIAKQQKEMLDINKEGLEQSKILNQHLEVIARVIGDKS